MMLMIEIDNGDDDDVMTMMWWCEEDDGDNDDDLMISTFSKKKRFFVSKWPWISHDIDKNNYNVISHEIYIKY